MSDEVNGDDDFGLKPFLKRRKSSRVSPIQLEPETDGPVLSYVGSSLPGTNAGPKSMVVRPPRNYGPAARASEQTHSERVLAQVVACQEKAVQREAASHKSETVLVDVLGAVAGLSREMEKSPEARAAVTQRMKELKIPPTKATTNPYQVLVKLAFFQAKQRSNLSRYASVVRAFEECGERDIRGFIKSEGGIVQAAKNDRLRHQRKPEMDKAIVLSSAVQKMLENGRVLAPGNIKTLAGDGDICLLLLHKREDGWLILWGDPPSDADIRRADKGYASREK
jgi:hypothetical protein